MAHSKENSLETALKILRSPGNQSSPWKVAKATGACYNIIKRRLEGGPSSTIRNGETQLLTPMQETLLEVYIMYLSQKKKIPEG